MERGDKKFPLLEHSCFGSQHLNCCNSVSDSSETQMKQTSAGKNKEEINLAALQKTVFKLRFLQIEGDNSLEIDEEGALGSNVSRSLVSA